MTIVLNLAICVFLLLGTVVPSKAEMQDPDIDLLVQLHTGTDEQSQSQIQVKTIMQKVSFQLDAQYYLIILY